jgi:hypothetical protein
MTGETVLAASNFHACRDPELAPSFAVVATVKKHLAGKGRA